MYDNDDKPHLLRGLFNALLIEGFSLIVIIGLVKIVFAILNTVI